MKLVENLGDGWYDQLWRLFNSAWVRGDFQALSSALGHDPDDWYDNSEHDEEGEDSSGGDMLDPESLEADKGWTWDLVREELLMGRGSGDLDTIAEVLEWLGANADGIREMGGELKAAPDELFTDVIPERIIAATIS